MLLLLIIVVLKYLVNGLSAFFIEGKSVFSNGSKSLPSIATYVENYPHQ